jgi:hypothetical protein
MNSDKYTFDMQAGGHILGPGADGDRPVIAADIADANDALAVVNALNVLKGNKALAAQVAKECALIATKKSVKVTVIHAENPDDLFLADLNLLPEWHVTVDLGSHHQEYEVRALTYEMACNTIKNRHMPACLWSVQPKDEYDAMIARRDDPSRPDSYERMQEKTRLYWEQRRAAESA